jgi:hypothetical protein
MTGTGAPSWRIQYAIEAGKASGEGRKRLI